MICFGCNWAFLFYLMNDVIRSINLKFIAGAHYQFEVGGYSASLLPRSSRVSGANALISPLNFAERLRNRLSPEIACSPMVLPVAASDIITFPPIKIAFFFTVSVT